MKAGGLFCENARFHRQTLARGRGGCRSEQIAHRVGVRERTVHRDDGIEQRDEIRPRARGVERSAGLSFGRVVQGCRGGRKMTARRRAA